MNTTPVPSVPISVRVPIDVYTAAREAATSAGRTLSGFVADLVRERVAEPAATQESAR